MANKDNDIAPDSGLLQKVNGMMGRPSMRFIDGQRVDLNKKRKAPILKAVRSTAPARAASPYGVTPTIKAPMLAQYMHDQQLKGKSYFSLGEIARLINKTEQQAAKRMDEYLQIEGLNLCFFANGYRCQSQPLANDKGGTMEIIFNLLVESGEPMTCSEITQKIKDNITDYPTLADLGENLATELQYQIGNVKKSKTYNFIVGKCEPKHKNGRRVVNTYQALGFKTDSVKKAAEIHDKKKQSEAA